MDRTEVYSSLRDKILNYPEYANMPLDPTAEELVAIPRSGTVVGRATDEETYPHCGGTVYVRWNILQKLREAGKLIQEYSATYQLEVICGYGDAGIGGTCEQLTTAAPRDIGIPRMTSHLTGGAVDVQVTAQGKPLVMGTPLWDSTPDSFTFSPFISKAAWSNRQVLRRIMLAVGFAPFDGNWWHFSYGDKAWAKYYGERAAIYGPVAFSGTEGLPDGEHSRSSCRHDALSFEHDDHLPTWYRFCLSPRRAKLVGGSLQCRYTSSVVMGLSLCWPETSRGENSIQELVGKRAVQAEQGVYLTCNTPG